MSRHSYTIFERGYLILGKLGSNDRRAISRMTRDPLIAGKTYDDYVLRITGDRLYAGKYVGVVDYGGGRRIEILPKLAKNDTCTEEAKTAVMRMLRRVYRLDFKLHSISQLAKSNLDVYEILICMYLRELTKLLKRGLKSGYVSVEDNLPYMKGKLMINHQVRVNAVRRDRFYVCCDEFSTDRPENRLIAATVKKLLSASADEKNRRELRRCREMMGGIEPSVNIDRDFAAVVDDRTTADYRLLMNWSRFFLRDHSFDAFSGSENVSAMLFPVEELFEKYVGIRMKKTFASAGFTVRLQHTRAFCQGFNIRPDLVIEKDGRTVILDTKWKLLNNFAPKYGIREKDLYQMFVYARTYRTDEVWLLYPKPIGETEDIPSCFELPDGVKVHIVLIDLCGEKENDLTDLLKEVENNRKKSISAD